MSTSPGPFFWCSSSFPLSPPSCCSPPPLSFIIHRRHLPSLPLPCCCLPSPLIAASPGAVVVRGSCCPACLHCLTCPHCLSGCCLCVIITPHHWSFPPLLLLPPHGCPPVPPREQLLTAGVRGAAGCGHHPVVVILIQLMGMWSRHHPATP
jgi:hypothetical protein